MITINEESIPEDLTILEYFILYCLFHKIPCEPYPQYLESLNTKRYVRFGDNLELREKTIDLFVVKEDKALTQFLEVFNNYPIKTYSGRRLRPVKIESKEFQELFKKYKAKVISQNKHQEVLKCLDNELRERKKSNSLEYMHEMVTWINGEKWDRFYSVKEEITERVESI